MGRKKHIPETRDSSLNNEPRQLVQKYDFTLSAPPSQRRTQALFRALVWQYECENVKMRVGGEFCILHFKVFNVDENVLPPRTRLLKWNNLSLKYQLQMSFYC